MQQGEGGRYLNAIHGMDDNDINTVWTTNSGHVYDMFETSVTPVLASSIPPLTPLDQFRGHGIWNRHRDAVIEASKLELEPVYTDDI